MSHYRRRHAETHAKKQFRMATIPRRRKVKQSVRLRDWRLWGRTKTEANRAG